MQSPEKNQLDEAQEILDVFCVQNRNQVKGPTRYKSARRAYKILPLLHFPGFSCQMFSSATHNIIENEGNNR